MKIAIIAALAVSVVLMKDDSALAWREESLRLDQAAWHEAAHVIVAWGFTGVNVYSVSIEGNEAFSGVTTLDFTAYEPLANAWRDCAISVAGYVGLALSRHDHGLAVPPEYSFDYSDARRDARFVMNGSKPPTLTPPPWNAPSPAWHTLPMLQACEERASLQLLAHEREYRRLATLLKGYRTLRHGTLEIILGPSGKWR